jgi:nucleoside-diphosphate-sugar epimerase
MNTAPKTCLVVGGRGYLGSELIRYLQGAGWLAISASRRSRETGDIPYSLGDDFPPGALNGIDALVHCAYDFAPSSWDQIYQKNVLGTERLLDQATRSGIKNILTISSISAFPGCRSLYGKSKLRIEKATLAAGGVVLRPGLIYGGQNQGMFGRLVNQVNRGKPIPLLAGSPCTQFLVHVEELCRVIESILSRKVSRPTEVWTVAHPAPWPLRTLLTAIAGDRRISFIPVPWQPVWLALRVAELIGLKMTFKSDSVRSIVYQNTSPDLHHVTDAGFELRTFRPGAT